MPHTGDMFLKAIGKAITDEVVSYNLPYLVLEDGDENPLALIEVAFYAPSYTPFEEVHVKLIAVPADARGKGYASKLFKLVLSAADSLGWAVTGHVRPWPGRRGEKSMTRGQLKKWYRRLGFKINRDNDMVRLPQ